MCTFWALGRRVKPRRLWGTNMKSAGGPPGSASHGASRLTPNIWTPQIAEHLAFSRIWLELPSKQTVTPAVKSVICCVMFFLFVKTFGQSDDWPEQQLAHLGQSNLGQAYVGQFHFSMKANLQQQILVIFVVVMVIVMF